MKITAILLAAACAPAAAQSVETVKVTSARAERTLRLPGELLPFFKTTLRARVTGFVERVDVDRGSAVKEGQTLVRLSAPELAAQIAEAAAKAHAVESQRSEAQARLAAAESTHQRMKEASATPGVVAANELIAAAQVVEAGRAQIAALQAAAGAARSALEPLTQLESYLDVKAPYDGIITERHVHPGALAGPAAGNVPLLEIEQHSRLRLVLSVPEAEAASIAPGAAVVRFRVPAFPNAEFSGAIARISHSLDLKTRGMAVEIDVANPRRTLAPGMYASAEWPVRRPAPSLLVPPTAVVTTTERSFVIRVHSGRAQWVNVTRGPAAGEFVEITGPLAVGDEVVRRATDEIRDGSPLSPARK